MALCVCTTLGAQGLHTNRCTGCIHTTSARHPQSSSVMRHSSASATPRQPKAQQARAFTSLGTVPQSPLTLCVIQTYAKAVVPFCLNGCTPPLDPRSPPSRVRRFKNKYDAVRCLCVAAGAAHPPPAVVLRRGRHAEDGDDFDVSLVVLVGETPVRAAQLPEAVSAYLDPLLALDGPAMPGALVQRPAPMCCTTTVTRVIGAGAGDEGSSDLPWFQLTIVLEFIPALGEGGALGLAEVLPAVGLASTLVRDCGWDPADLHGLRRVRMVDGSFATTTASMGPVWRSTLRMPSTVGAAPPPGMPLSSPPMRPSCALLEGDTDGGSDADTDDDDGETPSTVYDSDATIPWTASL